MEFAIQVYKWLYDLILVLVIVSHGDDLKKLKLNVVGCAAESNQQPPSSQVIASGQCK